MVSAIDVSKWFIANNQHVASSTRLGHVKLQKLLYYSKAMYYAVYDKPLFNERIEAWENGPVVKDAYIEYKYNRLPDYFKSSDCPELDADVEQVLKVVNYIYGQQTANSLIDLTHGEEPWKELEREVEEKNNPVIEETKIHEYYKPLADLFNAIDDEELENTVFVNINGNVFSYDKRYVTITASDKEKLTAYGDVIKDQNYTVFKDEDEELVVY